MTAPPFDNHREKLGLPKTGQTGRSATGLDGGTSMPAGQRRTLREVATDDGRTWLRMTDFALPMTPLTESVGKSTEPLVGQGLTENEVIVHDAPGRFDRTPIF